MRFDLRKKVCLCFVFFNLPLFSAKLITEIENFSITVLGKRPFCDGFQHTFSINFWILQINIGTYSIIIINDT